jgi:hypothetical protein
MGTKALLEIPEGTENVVLDNPIPDEECAWQLHLADGFTRRVSCGEPIPVAQMKLRQITIARVRAPRDTSVAVYVDRMPRADAVVRRLLTEARDRLMTATLW